MANEPMRKKVVGQCSRDPEVVPVYAVGRGVQDILATRAGVAEPRRTCAPRVKDRQWVRCGSRHPRSLPASRLRDPQLQAPTQLQDTGQESRIVSALVGSTQK